MSTKNMKKSKSKLDWFKKNIVIVPVIGAILAGTITSVRYVFTMTDTIQINKEKDRKESIDRRYCIQGNQINKTLQEDFI